MTLQYPRTDGAYAADSAVEEGYGFREPTPEERAEKSVDTIWSAHSEELQHALRKLTDNA